MYKSIIPRQGVGDEDGQGRLCEIVLLDAILTHILPKVLPFSQLGQDPMALLLIVLLLVPEM